MLKYLSVSIECIEEVILVLCCCVEVALREWQRYSVSQFSSQSVAEQVQELLCEVLCVWYPGGQHVSVVAIL